ncbi:hypothetical protein [Marinicella gelatinilytica]|uniref:hypothetical protein n=1 Tax=Marinicella gelatinilytica TaxID=2996017 RepID=UPI002260CA13|nr:hypothetical protein [Marinicella gelatinilytica]MCX7545484.1 hypothetical protein [Marinicella gelatinilytica]
MKDKLFEKWTKIYWILMTIYLIVGVSLAFIWEEEKSLEYAAVLIGYGIISIDFYGLIIYGILSIPVLLYIKFKRHDK